MVIEGLSPELGHWRTFVCCCCCAAVAVAAAAASASASAAAVAVAVVALLANPELFKVYMSQFLKKVQLPQTIRFTVCFLMHTLDVGVDATAQCSAVAAAASTAAASAAAAVVAVF